jgi:hypothetical protein
MMATDEWNGEGAGESRGRGRPRSSGETFLLPMSVAERKVGGRRC